MKTIRNYQMTAIERGVKQNLAVFDQMGLGKSLTAIEITKEIFNQYNAPALVICPKSIKSQWRDMILDQDTGAQVTIIEHEPTDYSWTFDWYIIHYEAVVTWLQYLSPVTFSTIVVDEGHRIKNRKARRTVAIKHLKAYRKLVLTGTPWDKRVDEVWSLLNFLEPKTFSSYWRFFDEHITFDVDYLGFKKNFRLKNPSNFSNAIRPHVIRRTKRMVMPELPPLITTYVPIELGQKQREIYDRIKAVKDLEVDDLTIPNALAKLVRLHQIASNPILLGYECSSAKIDWLKEWLTDNPDETVIIFTRYKLTASQLANELGATCVIGGQKLTGSLTASRRIVGTIAALAEGHDLGHLDTAIYLDCDWSSILMTQSCERIDRGSNTIPKNVIYLQATNTVDDLIKTALDLKLSTKQIVEKFLQEVENDLRVTL